MEDIKALVVDLDLVMPFGGNSKINDENHYDDDDYDDDDDDKKQQQNTLKTSKLWMWILVMLVMPCGDNCSAAVTTAAKVQHQREGDDTSVHMCSVQCAVCPSVQCVQVCSVQICTCATCSVEFVYCLGVSV